MLRRGQSIKVVEYYGNGGMRPKIGDVGYLSNMFLYPLHGFILADGMFYKYERDSAEKSRMEHKRFIIDIGMTKKLKHQIVNIGVNRRFFLKNFHVNLNPIGYVLRDYGIVENAPKGKLDYQAQGFATNAIWPRVVGTFGVWNRFTNNEGKSMDSKKVKLPCVKIRPHNMASNLLNKQNANLLRAWFMASASPLINIMRDYMRMELPAHDENSDLFSWMSRIQEALVEKMGPFYKPPNSDGLVPIDIDKELRMRMTTDFINTIVDKIKYLEIRHNMFISGLDHKTLTDIKENKKLTVMFKHFVLMGQIGKKPNALWNFPMDELASVNLHVCEVLINIYFRAILNSGDPSTTFKLLSEVGIDRVGKVAEMTVDELRQARREMAIDNSKLSILINN